MNMKWKVLLVLLVTAGTITAVPFIRDTIIQEYLVNKESIDENALIGLVNEYRVENNLEPFKADFLLCDIALARAQAIDQGIAEFNHDGFDELIETRSYLGKHYNLNAFDFYGENISEDASNLTDHEDVFNGWMGSPSHNALMLANYTHACAKTSNDVAVLIAGSNVDPY